MIACVCKPFPNFITCADSVSVVIVPFEVEEGPKVVVTLGKLLKVEVGNSLVRSLVRFENSLSVELSNSVVKLLQRHLGQLNFGCELISGQPK